MVKVYKVLSLFLLISLFVGVLLGSIVNSVIVFITLAFTSLLRFVWIEQLYNMIDKKAQSHQEKHILKKIS